MRQRPVRGPHCRCAPILLQLRSIEALDDVEFGHAYASVGDQSLGLALSLLCFQFLGRQGNAGCTAHLAPCLADQSFKIFFHLIGTLQPWSVVGATGCLRAMHLCSCEIIVRMIWQAIQ